MEEKEVTLEGRSACACLRKLALKLCAAPVGGLDLHRSSRNVSNRNVIAEHAARSLPL